MHAHMGGGKFCMPHLARRDVRKTFRTRKAHAKRLVNIKLTFPTYHTMLKQRSLN